jgi:hypothetical protein
MTISKDACAVAATIIATEAARTGSDRSKLITAWMETLGEIEVALEAKHQRWAAEKGRALEERLDAEAAAEQERRRLAGEEPLEPPGPAKTW